MDTNKHIMIEIDQDYTTTDTDEHPDKNTEKNIGNISNIDNISNISNINNINNIDNIDNIDKNLIKDTNIDESNLNNSINNSINNNEIIQSNILDNSILPATNENTMSNEILLKTLELHKNELKSKVFNKKIIEKLKTNIENEIIDATSWRFKWGKIATVTFCISEIFMIIQTLLSFTAASYQITLISYLAGIIGVIAVGFNRFGAYSKNRSTEKTNQLNDLLKTIGIDNSLPDLMEHIEKKEKK